MQPSRRRGVFWMVMDDTELAESLARDLDGVVRGARPGARRPLLLDRAARARQPARRRGGRPGRAGPRLPGARPATTPERIRDLRLRPWLATIVVNLCRNRTRRHAPATTPLDPLVEAGREPAAATRRRAPRGSPTAPADRERLAALLATLPDRYRVPVVLRHVDDLSYAELSEVLGRPEGTLKAQVSPGPRDAARRRRRHRARGADRMNRTYSPIPRRRRARRPRAPSPAPAPASLADDVLVEVGLADRMAPDRLAARHAVGRLERARRVRGGAGRRRRRGRAPATRPGPAAATIGRRRPARRHLADAIARRLAGERRVRIPLDLRGRTEFEVAVWTKALEIPRGEVRPYGWIAAEIGRPKAVRAVGTALGHNPVPLIVPCHRVVRTDGTIGQYSLGGPGNKRTILAAEGLDPEAMEAAARRGERLSGSTTTRIVCWPTCRHARRVAGPLPGLVPLAPRGAERRATGRARSAARSAVEAAA